MRAALDVFTNEPEIHPDLLNYYRVVCPSSFSRSDKGCLTYDQILSPHCAAAPGGDFAQQMNAEVVQNIVTYLTTGHPESAVNLKAVRDVQVQSDAQGV